MTQQPNIPASNLPPMEMPEDLEPLYSNLARISHTPAEIIVDFSRMLPAQARFKVLARVILSPIGAKFLLRALGENIARYEASFGGIQLPGESGLAGDLFKQVHPPKPPEES
jgi:hypothetical protein